MFERPATQSGRRHDQTEFEASAAERHEQHDAMEEQQALTHRKRANETRTLTDGAGEAAELAEAVLILRDGARRAVHRPRHVRVRALFALVAELVALVRRKGARGAEAAHRGAHPANRANQRISTTQVRVR